MKREPLYILLAESGKEVSLLGPHFADAGWQFDAVPDGESLMTAVHDNSYDIIITELEMPGLNGSDLIQKIHQNNPSQPILVVSSHQSVDQALLVLKEGASGYLNKPLDFSSLQHVVQQVVGAAKDLKEISLVKNADNQFASYCFSSAEIAKMKFPLAILDNLHEAEVIDQTTKLKIELAFQEALANSLEHGNLELESSLKDEFDEEGIDLFAREKAARLSDPQYAERKIFVSTWFFNNCLKIQIKDEGNGFQDKRDGFKAEEMLEELACYGRGVFLIRESMDRVFYREGGRELVMVKDFT